MVHSQFSEITLKVIAVWKNMLFSKSAASAKTTRRFCGIVFDRSVALFAESRLILKG